MAELLSDRLIQKLPSPERGNKIVYDQAVKMFGVRVTSRGVKSFILNYRFKKKERRITIGRFPEWSTAKARKEAQRLKREVDFGKDPLALRKEDRTRPLMSELCNRYLTEYAINKSLASQSDEKAMIVKIIRPALQSYAVEDV